MAENLYIPSIDDIFNAPLDVALAGIVIDFEETDTYKWSGAELTQQIGRTIPVVYGRHIVGGNLLNAYIEEGDNETLNMLIGVCEGEVEGITNVTVDGTPIEELYGNNPADPYGKSAEVTIRRGTSSQTSIEGFEDLHNYTSVLQALEQSVPYVFNGTLVDAEAFSIELEVDRLFQLNEDQNMLSWYISIQVEYKLSTDSIWTFMGVYEINKKTTTLFKRHIKSEYMTAGQYDIRVMKVSSDADGSNRFGVVRISSIDEIRTENLTYPSTALIGLRLLAVQELSNRLPNVLCIVTGKKVRVPKVVYTPLGDDLVDWEDYYWDGEAQRFKTIWNDAVVNWDGTTYIEAWSANPVWCLRDLLLNSRYGLGELISENDLDGSSFLASALYCEEGVDNFRNKKEKRFRLDIVLDTDRQVNDTLALMLQSFRGLMDTSKGVVRLSIERQADTVFLFNESNIVKNTFNLQYLTSKVPNVVSCNFTNKDKNYSMDAMEIGDEASIKSGESIRQDSFQLIGCTRTSQLIREAKIHLNKLKNNKIVANIEAYMDSILVQPNDVFYLQHELPSWGDGGRVQANSTTSLVKLEKAVTLDAGNTYEILVKNGADDTLEKRTISDGAGTYTEVNVSVPFSFTPAEFDLWAIGVEDVGIPKFRCLSASKVSSGLVVIQAVNYVADVYDPTAVFLPDDDYVHIDLSIPSVTSLTLRERTSRQPSGAILLQAEASFTKPVSSSKWVKSAVNFEIHLSDNGGKSWNLVGTTDKEYYLVPETLSKNQSYWIAVASVAEDGKKNLPSNSPRAEITPQGWQEAPAQVTGLDYEFEDQVDLFWDRNTDEDVAGYEVRYTNTDWGQAGDALIFKGNATSCTILQPFARSGILYYVKAFNNSGIYSAEPIIIEPVNSAPEATELEIIELFQKAFLSWTGLTDIDIVSYEVWRNSSNAWEGSESAEEVIVGRFVATSAVVEVPYAVTYFKIRGIDRFGAGAWSNTVTAEQVEIGNTDIADGAVQANTIDAGAIVASHLTASSILAEHIASNQITAEKMNIISLSSLSADIGCILAGTLVGTCIKTAETGERVELDQTGLFQYDENDNLIIKMSGGELCLIDPNDSAFYTFIDSGILKYHTPVGDIPSVKRLTSGVADAGETVTLCQWYETPHIMLGLKRLTSYYEPNLESTQEWQVYHDNVRFYCNSCLDFGWQFDVHAKLTLTGGTRCRCVMDVAFNTIHCTGTCTCAVLLEEYFQSWCNNDAPSEFYYGVVCFEVKYRTVGCGVWCSCSYNYEQPHSSKYTLCRCCKACQTVNFGGIGQYEIELNEICSTFYPSGIMAGSSTTNVCQLPYQVDWSYLYCCDSNAEAIMNVSAYSVGYQDSTIRACNCKIIYYYLNFKNECDAIISQYVCYNIQGCIGGFGSVQGYYGGGNSNDTRLGYAKVDSQVCVANVPIIPIQVALYSSARSFAFKCTYYCGGGTVIRDTYDRYKVCSSCSFFHGFASGRRCMTLCKIRCCTFTCWTTFLVWSGSACCCQYNRWHSRREVSGTENILDPNGEVTYLAVAYS